MIKFVLQKVVKLPQGKRTEDEYHYASEDGKHVAQFHAGTRPWTWVVSGGNMALLNADELVNEFCVQAMQNDKPVFEDKIRELSINLKE